jgi:hypothetical protein
VRQRVVFVPPKLIGVSTSIAIFEFFILRSAACLLHPARPASSRMSANTGDDVRAVAAEIVRYLRAHPEAADTVEGAARWWLRREPPAQTIVRAMMMLVDQRIVEKYTLPEGTTVFRGGPRLASHEPSNDP